MTTGSAQPTSLIEWGVASRPIPGETLSGDQYVVAPFEGGVLIAAIDGLGHGAAAAGAARQAAATLADAPGQPLRQLVDRCHAAMRNSRGAVMTLVALDGRTDRMTWTAVGNVEASLCRASDGETQAREGIVPRGGVVGYQLPALRETTLPIARGDVLILATDGLRHDFVLDWPARANAQDYASYLLDRYGKDSDDALALVVRYLGRSQ
jgi:negative regulator of sigma-B (phosphoserine phosphatase)